MATLSRGCLCLRGLTSRSLKFPQPIRGLQDRWFTNSRDLGFASRKPLPSKKAYQPPKKPAPLNRIPTAASPIVRAPAKYQTPQTKQETFVSSLAKRSSPTLLYQAPSHTAYVLATYAFSIYAFSYSGYNFYTACLYPTTDLEIWVSYSMGVVCFMMACLGAWIFLGSFRLIRSITAIPVHSSSQALSLRVESRRTISLPFVKPHVFSVAPSDLFISSRLAHASAKNSSLAEEEALRREKEALIRDRTRIMTAPFRQMGRAIWKALTYLSRIFTRQGFFKVLIRGKAGHWQLDSQGGWALEDGKALDKLVRVK